jgi:hypothetical protein
LNFSSLPIGRNPSGSRPIVGWLPDRIRYDEETLLLLR